MNKSMIIGVDLGGTFIKFGIFEESGQLLEKWQVPTGDTHFSKIFEKIALQIQEKVTDLGYSMEQVKGVGMGVPGSVNSAGMLISAPNLGWSMLDVNRVMKEYLSVPVYIGNDANVAALGEQYFGVGEGCDSMVMITLGTGVGGGVIVNQRLVAGAFGGAGEIGHMVINNKETVACTCGNKGCLEQYASATGIANMAKKMLVTALAEQQEESDAASMAEQQEKTIASVVMHTEDGLQNADFQYAVSSLQQFELDELTAKEVFDAVKAGDELACQVAEQFGETLGKALSFVACVADPEMFVIGGGVSAAGEVLLEYVEKYYRQYAFAPSKETAFKLATLGNDAGICGAARLVMLGK